jgi:protease-4
MSAENSTAPSPQIIIQQPPSMFGRFGKLLLVVIGICILLVFSLIARYQSYFTPADQPRERFHSLSRTAAKKIAIVRVEGAILDTDDFVKRQIDRIREDDSVVAVVARINSPGGTVTASDYIHYHLQKLADDRDLPLVVSMGSICASGGYYVAMAVGPREDSIFAERATWTGSIGVIIPHFNFSGLLDRMAIEDDSIASGELKDLGSYTKPMTPEERAVLQELVMESFGEFKEIVLAGRPKLKDKPDDLAAVTTGRIFTAQQALDRGLVDKIGFLEDAIERAAELAGVSTDEVRCVEYEQPSSVLGSLLGEEDLRASLQSGPSLRGVLELATPRAYYLWTWLPGALTSE